jgi:hypothetical protein
VPLTVTSADTVFALASLRDASGVAAHSCLAGVVSAQAGEYTVAAATGDTRCAGQSAAVVILAGAGAAAYAISTRSDQESRRHFVTVLLDPEVTPEQRAAVEEELQGWDPAVGPEFKSSGDVASAAAEMYQDDPEAAEQAADIALPATFIMTVESPVFDCGPVPALLELPGVQDIMIDGSTEPGGRPRRIQCP